MKQLRNFKNHNSQIPEEVQKNAAFGEAMQKYGGMNEDALIEQLIMQIRQSRQNGTYSAAQTEAYVNMISPHLTEVQRQKLSNILKIINSENV